jgi:lysozyme
MSLRGLQPMPGWLLGVDLGAPQGLDVDWPALKANGVAFAWLRCTDGEHDVDPTFARNASECVRLALPFGVYGVLEPYGSARAAAQADHLLGVAKGSGATLPPWMDFELARGLTALQALMSAVMWRDDVQKAIGFSPIVYAGPAFIAQLERLGGAPAFTEAQELALSPLAVAHYTTATRPLIPAPWTDWTIWQRQGNGGAQLPGLSVDVDVDWYRGSVDELVALGRPADDALATGT